MLTSIGDPAPRLALPTHPQAHTPRRTTIASLTKASTPVPCPTPSAMPLQYAGGVPAPRLVCSPQHNALPCAAPPYSFLPTCRCLRRAVQPYDNELDKKANSGIVVPLLPFGIKKYDEVRQRSRAVQQPEGRAQGWGVEIQPPAQAARAAVSPSPRTLGCSPRLPRCVRKAPACRPDS